MKKHFIQLKPSSGRRRSSYRAIVTGVKYRTTPRGESNSHPIEQLLMIR